MALAWGIWAALQSRKHDLRRFERVFPLDPAALLFAVTLMWPIALPWFLRLRHRALTGRLRVPARPSRARYALVALAFLAPLGALAVPRLLERLPFTRELEPIHQAALEVAGEPVEVSLRTGGMLTITVLHHADEGELHEERADVAHRIAVAAVQAGGSKATFRTVRVAFMWPSADPASRKAPADDVFEWTVLELRGSAGA